MKLKELKLEIKIEVVKDSRLAQNFHNNQDKLVLNLECLKMKSMEKEQNLIIKPVQDKMEMSNQFQVNKKRLSQKFE